jgi:hypothetical protein
LTLKTAVSGTVVSNQGFITGHVCVVLSVSVL